MSYFNFTIETSHACVSLSCLRFLEFPDRAVVSTGIPDCWVSAVNAVTGTDSRRIYDVFHTILPMGMRNAVTDRKKVWGLRNIARGDADLAYSIANPLRTVYTGLRRCPSLSDSTASLVICLSDGAGGRAAEEILPTLRDGGFDFSGDPHVPSPVLTAVAEQYDAVVLHYYINSVCGLTVYGGDSRRFGAAFEPYFDEQSVPVFKPGLLPI